MLPTTRPTSIGQNHGTNRNSSENTTPLAEQTSPSVIVACFVVTPDQAETLITTLQRIAATSSGGSFPSVTPPSPKQELDATWLTHSDAARYLGVAISTLYRYAEKERIECRKLGNRLEYRRSSLDRFKENQIRPPRHPRSRGIITPTLGSGN